MPKKRQPLTISFIRTDYSKPAVGKLSKLEFYCRLPNGSYIKGVDFKICFTRKLLQHYVEADVAYELYLEIPYESYDKLFIDMAGNIYIQRKGCELKKLDILPLPVINAICPV